MCERWGLHPSSVLVVGDSEDDIRCGLGAGAQTCVLGDAGGEAGRQANFEATTLGEVADVVEASLGEQSRL